MISIVEALDEELRAKGLDPAAVRERGAEIGRLIERGEFPGVRARKRPRLRL